MATRIKIAGGRLIAGERYIRKRISRLRVRIASKLTPTGNEPFTHPAADGGPVGVSLLAIRQFRRRITYF
jgi:hypothetical protein